MTVFFQQTINGIVSGSALALVALGFTFIYGIVRVLNLAHPQIYMWGAFITYVGVNANLPVVVTALLVIGVGAGWGVFLDRAVFRWLRTADLTTPFIATMGLALAMQSLAVKIFGPQPKSLPGILPSGSVHAGGLHLGMPQLTVVLATIAVLAGLWFLVAKTWFGRCVRATAENAEGASSLGVNTEVVMLLTVIIASCCAALAGFLIAGLYHQSFAYMGDIVGLQALVVIKVGGLGNLPGAALAALLLGLVQAYSTQYLSASYADGIVFAVLFVVLILRPQGLLGEQVRSK
jgi:branched-chain amino acid transport system permease protein